MPRCYGFLPISSGRALGFALLALVLILGADAIQAQQIIVADSVGDNDGFGYGAAVVRDGGSLPPEPNFPEWFFDNRTTEERNDPRATFTDCEPVREGSSAKTYFSYDHIFNPQIFATIDSGYLIIDLAGVQQGNRCSTDPTYRDSLWLDGALQESFLDLNQQTYSSGPQIYVVSGKSLLDGRLALDFFQLYNCGTEGDVFAIDYSQLVVFGTAAEPIAPTLILPQERAQLTTPQPQFVWSGNSLFYIFEIATNSQFDPLLYQAGHSDTVLNYPLPLNEGTHYWRVASFDATGKIGPYSQTGSFEIVGAPTADFTASPLSGTVPLQVDFDDQSSGSVTSYLWNFGDGTTSNLVNPAHSYGAPGLYTVGLAVTGPGGSDSEVKVNYIEVLAANQPPSFVIVSDTAIEEGQLWSQDIEAIDPDGPYPAIIPLELPTGAATSYPNGQPGPLHVNWTPEFNQAGNHPLSFLAIDGVLSDTLDFVISVINVNRPPSITAPISASTQEGGLLEFPVTATDPDDEFISLGADSLPVNANFSETSDSTAIFSWTPNAGEAGEYRVVFFVTDGELADTAVTVITVGSVNHRPVGFAPDSVEVDEGQLLQFLVTGTDPDGDQLQIFTDQLPASAALIDSANGTALFLFAPGFNQSDGYNVPFYVSDGELVDTVITNIRVNDVNRAPVIATLDTAFGVEGQLITFSVNAADPDGTTPTLTIDFLPAGATFVPNGPGGAIFSWTPGLNEAGIYRIFLTAIDQVDPTVVDTQSVYVVVNNANSPPDLLSIGSFNIDVGEPLEISMSAVDPDNDPITFAVEPLPAGANIVTLSSDSAVFLWTPNSDQDGFYNLFFIASDGELADTQFVSITVTAGNQPPIVNGGPDRFVELCAGEQFCWNAVFDDPDGNLAEANVRALSNIPFSVSGFIQVCAFPDTSGSYIFIFQGVDSLNAMTEDTVTVTFDVDQAPQCLVPNDTTITVCSPELVCLPVSVFDPDSNVAICLITQGPGALSNGTWCYQPAGSESVVVEITCADSCGSECVSQFAVDFIFGDTIPPNMICAGDADVPCGQSTDPGDLGLFPEVSDNCDPDPAITYSDGPVTSGAFERMWTATDDAGNSVSCIQTITVEDTEPPVISCPDSVTVACDIGGIDPAVTGLPEVDDNCSDSIFVTYQDADIIPGEIIDRTWTARDEAGNESSCVQTIQLLDDQPPVFTCPPMATYNCDQGTPDPNVTGRPNASDNCTAQPDVFFMDSLVDDTVFRTWNASDDAGNSAECVQRIVCTNSFPSFVSPLAGDTMDIVEEMPYNMTIEVTDNDGDPISIFTSGLPESGSFEDYGDGTGLLTILPRYNEVDEVYFIEVNATDGSNDIFDDFYLQVVNRPLDVEQQTGSLSSIRIDSSFQIVFNEQIEPATLNGNVGYTSAKSSTTIQPFHQVDQSERSVLFFQPDGPFEQLDTIMVTLNTGILDLAGYPLTAPRTETFYTGAVVRAGDANNDGIVDERDILPIGLYFGASGPARDATSLGFVGQPADVFTDLLRWNPFTAVYADADGSGMVDADDICGVAFNWQLTATSKIERQSYLASVRAELSELNGSVIDEMLDALIGCPQTPGAQSLREVLEESRGRTESSLPESAELFQNYPNPFNPTTMIRFYLPERSAVRLDVFNLLGQHIATLMEGIHSGGFGEVEWDARDDSGVPVASGLYLYRLTIGETVLTRRMVLLK